MSELSKLLGDELRAEVGQVFTATEGVIVSLDGDLAQVKPARSDLPLLVQVRILKHRYKYLSQYHFWDEDLEEWEYVNPAEEDPIFHSEVLEVVVDYQEGDQVLVVFLDKDLSSGVIVGLL